MAMDGECNLIVPLLPGADHARPMPPMGATPSRRWRKREALIQECDRLTAWPVGDAPGRVAEIQRTLDTQ